ncbi:MAG: aminotransferase class III-fold pyridoxal phosphate-dependent enzyme, partial [Flavobacteriales bacterium]|nr:aminotransferase class III-fold pyridoxal phosphate-dependent enzyme [Flavobacteriales bacterium]
MNSKTHSIQRVQSKDLFERSKVLFPGGVNSPVRAFGSVGGTPLFMEKGQGAYIWDADGNRFIDFCCSWGPLILGHAHPRVEERIIEAVRNGTTFGTPTRLENELGSLIVDHPPYVAHIRFVSSGTEAAMSAIRLA